MQATLNAIISIVRTPAILVGLIAILGQALQKKSFSDTVSSGIKTFIGFLVFERWCWYCQHFISADEQDVYACFWCSGSCS